MLWIGRGKYRFTVTQRSTEYDGQTYARGVILWRDGSCGPASKAMQMAFRALLAERKTGAL